MEKIQFNHAVSTVSRRQDVQPNIKLMNESRYVNIYLMGGFKPWFLVLINH